MQNLWSSEEAQKCKTLLQQRVYSSRLLGGDPALVLHGGGNTSVKIKEKNIFGKEVDILYVKGSGWDLASIEEPGFTPIRMKKLLKLAKLDTLSDTQMVNEMKTGQTIAAAPTGSVEAILHAALPFTFVDHTHADAVVTITNTPNGEERIREIYGDDIVIIPYVMPGFDLARLVAERFNADATDKTIGMVLMNHGIFSFADSAELSYKRMIDLVGRAEEYLKAQEAWELPLIERAIAVTDVEWAQLAELRRDLSKAMGVPLILKSDRGAEALSFCRRSDLPQISQRGPATPDHVIRTKRVPMIGKELQQYIDGYRDYFSTHAESFKDKVTMLDPVPRVILFQDRGMLTVGKNSTETSIINDIYRHTMEIIQRAELLGGWQALAADKIFEVEYWELEQAKLRKGGIAPEFQGEVALVTGAASGIGKACVESLLKRGAAVIGIDLDSKIETIFTGNDYLGITGDITSAETLTNALNQGITCFGGLDMLILNAGMFPGGKPISALDDGLWRKVMAVNLDANLAIMRRCYPLLSLAPNKGRVVVIGSKNVPAPGPGAAAYSASKAALNQLARVAALEWGKDGIRINSLHPDAVFDTALWGDGVLEARAEHYGMGVEEYKTKNILKTEVTSRDVAELAAAMCGALFAKTTAAQVPVDGGNDRVI